MDRKNLTMAILGAIMLVLVAGVAGAMITTNMKSNDKTPNKQATPGKSISWNQPAAAPAPAAVAAVEPPCDDGNIVGHAVGGVVGGVAGSQIGKGTGKTAATIGGTLGGAALGGYLPTKNVTCR